ncbi:MAG: hypothetical protein K6C34_02490 [Alphaproteobacteria bacterium]|nr:hypothetical protein [Alphaproteobacteria bacterium]
MKMTVTQLFNHFSKPYVNEIYYVEGMSMEKADQEGRWNMTTLVRSFEVNYGDREIRDWKLWNDEKSNKQFFEIALKKQRRIQK